MSRAGPAESPAVQAEGAVGFGPEAYRQRADGISPEPIRDAAWALAGREASGTVIDVGSGAGGWIRRLQQNPRVERILSVDLVAAGADAIPGVEFHLADLSRDALPSGDATVDWVFALEVIEHLANPRHFFQQAHRVLRPGGRLFLTTPCNDSLTARLSMLFRGYYPAFCEHDYRGSGHITALTELDLRRIADETGFSGARFDYPLPGRMPKSAIPWQRLAPWLKGRLWSDSLIATFTR